MDLHDEWLSSTRKYIKFDQWETGKTLYSILHRIMDLTKNKYNLVFCYYIKCVIINMPSQHEEWNPLLSSLCPFFLFAVIVMTFRT